MPKLFEIKYPEGCKTIPEGFWSAVDVWIKKPHVVNKRLCGVKETESRHLAGEALSLVLGDNEELPDDVLNFIITSSAITRKHTLSYHIRTFIPKVNIYGTHLRKEVVVKDFDRQQVTFLPFEEDEKGKVTLKKCNIYQIQLHLTNFMQWLLELHVFTADTEWHCDGVAYPRLSWLSTELLPKLLRWSTECRSGDFTSTLSLLPVEKYSLTYQQLKDKYKAMVKVWPEVTDPEKFVYEDVAIATYLLHPGKGIDVRKRKIWDMYDSNTLLEEQAITPSESFLFPDTDWLIGNHSDELTPWIPVIAARSSYSCRYFVLPCCFFDFFGKYQRRHSQKSQYKEYIDFIADVSRVSGFDTQVDCLRIPSTKRVCLVGRLRNYQTSDEAQAEDRRARYIQSRVSEVETDAVSSSWGAGFQPREKVEVVRNCGALSRDFVDGVVLRVANALLGMTVDDGQSSSSNWNTGGSLSLGDVASLLRQDTLQQLKKECGGLQTLLKNNHQVFQVEGGRVHIRDWRDRRPPRSGAKKRPVAPGALKTRPCWFHSHHPQGCPLLAQDCTFAHGGDDLRPSTRPQKKSKRDV
ncbi:probable tRNA (uracil-O(2)-)-methyltransferase isoform X2 [Dunckerocampus dactyliophorus]|uniref:probable tRNA (uracil-O(2)-)-methyltransferase isoform X2 n=1 Tax=Dunckerocampus dactyliophorus TaxID=161453 RepID=UPI002405A80A|nr:probable tRNA (uracil-O(2)-)-methyltransferase isoform X2 [Dunckerocampus dactyliophorus]